MSPVDVVISHFPPDAVFGTSTVPVPLFAEKALSLSRLPVTLPVLVLTKISAESHLSNLTLPVPVLILINSKEDAPFVTSPVISETSMLSNLKSPGILRLPVSESIESAPYSPLGIYTAISGASKSIPI